MVCGALLLRFGSGMVLSSIARVSHVLTCCLINERVMVCLQTAAWDKTVHDETEDFSYYERQQRKYGRGRRGSTSFAGAFDLFFEIAKAAPEPEPAPVCTQRPVRVCVCVCVCVRRGGVGELAAEHVALQPNGCVTM